MNGHPSSSGASDQDAARDSGEDAALLDRFRSWLNGLLRFRNGEDSARDVLDELIEEREEAEIPIDEEERVLLANILELRRRTIHDVMVPRADIIAIGRDASLSEVIGILTKDSHSRLPVYGKNLDDAVGMVHIKDVLAWHGGDDDFSLANVLRNILFVSPSMQVLELLLEMRAKRSHMALVVDEYGGVDGLVTIEDLVEEIVGEIEDEHDMNIEPRLVQQADGSFIADARVTFDMLVSLVGEVIIEGEHEDVETLGGFVSSLAGRIPVRGELIRHPSGLEFEILDADPRRIKSLRVLIPPPRNQGKSGQ